MNTPQQTNLLDEMDIDSGRSLGARSRSPAPAPKGPGFSTFPPPAAASPMSPLSREGSSAATSPRTPPAAAAPKPPPPPSWRVPPVPSNLTEEEAIRHVQGLLSGVELELKDAIQDKEAQWQEERELLETMLSANSEKRNLLVREIEKVHARLFKKDGTPVTGPSSGNGPPTLQRQESRGANAGRLRNLSVDEMQDETTRLKQLERKAQDDVVRATRTLASCAEEEYEIYETKVSAHRDTAKLLRNQINAMEAKLKALKVRGRG
jgi:hypothetical protein